MPTSIARLSDIFLMILELEIDEAFSIECTHVNDIKNKNGVDQFSSHGRFNIVAEFRETIFFKKILKYKKKWNVL